MTIRITCPSCAKVFHVEDDLVGKRIRCRSCGTAVPVRRDDADPPDVLPARADDWVLPAPARRAHRDDDGLPPKKPGGSGLGPALLVGCGVAGLVCLVLAGGLVVALVARSGGGGPNLPPQAALPAGPVPAQIDPGTVARVKESTVFLRVQLPNGDVAEGSGFFCQEPGVVVTNAHVLGMLRSDAVPPARVEVVAHSGEPNELRMVGSVLGVDRDNDLAVLRVPGGAGRLPPPLPVDTATHLTETQKVYVFGFPLGSSLGKNITVSESSVSSLRRDEAGHLAEVQVNGGMHPGNSGGPVADARGAVVGVSVAGIRGTQINFAIPGDFVHQLFDGQFDAAEVGTPYLAGGRPTLPVRVTCLDPLHRLQNLRVEVWTGGPGTERPASWRAPPRLPGDGARRSYPLTARNGAYAADVPLASLTPGQVCWLQPVLVNAAGATLWDTARPVAWDAQLVLERRPATLQFQAPTAPIERTLKVTRSVTASLYRGNDAPVAYTSKLEGGVLESLSPDQRGIGTLVRLTIGPCSSARETPGKKVVPPPEAYRLLSQFSPTFLVDAHHACKERGRRDFRVVAAAQRDTVEGLYETVCNTFEATTVPLPNRPVQPLQSWRAAVPMLVLVEGKREIRDLHLTCTYEGMRTAAGRSEAFVALSGQVKGRGPNAGDVLGLVKGEALLDVDRGFFTRVKLTVNSEVEVEERGLRVLVSQDSLLTRGDGNSLGITAATVNQPGAR